MRGVSFVISKEMLLLLNWMLSGHRTYKWITECCSEVQPACCGGKPAHTDPQCCPYYSTDGVCRKGKFEHSQNLIMLSFVFLLKIAVKLELGEIKITSVSY
jgi:hypothetical protein